MEYIMKSGVLTQTGTDGPGREAARIKGAFGVRKTILTEAESGVFYTDIREEAPSAGPGGPQGRSYVLLDQKDRVLALARPGYAPGEDPAQAGWPAYRLPRVDHAAVRIGPESYILWMKDSRDYQLARGEETVLRVLHRGIPGGWDLMACAPFSPEVLCALFVFCRYLEQENEYITV